LPPFTIYDKQSHKPGLFFYGKSVLWTQLNYCKSPGNAWCQLVNPFNFTGLKFIQMLCIDRYITDPYFNIAAEEYVLKEFSEEVFMLWQNEPCIIVGKHQNTLAEINLEYVREQKIPVVRRITGGGTVFHDLGNLNFTFIKNGENEKLVNFRMFTEPIIEVLRKMAIEARFEGRNDLTINGRKFSGNAEHVHKNRVLHHGTLLFSTELNNLTRALKVDPSKFNDKAVKSVRSRVTNISEHLKQPMDIIEFKDIIQGHLNEKFGDISFYQFTESDKSRINQLVKEKYNTWDWNFGYSPQYNFRRQFKADGGNIEINLDVKNGIIENIKIYGDYFSLRDTGEIEELLLNQPHKPETIRERLAEIDIDLYFKHVTKDELIRGMF
jgi:lipoate-protein ligase A